MDGVAVFTITPPALIAICPRKDFRNSERQPEAWVLWGNRTAGLRFVYIPYYDLEKEEP